tara:strand:- start:556 stop:1266 length:711 start_codon:yes stop_codon:yes gene_type:complete
VANIKLTSALAATAISFTVSVNSISASVSGETEVVSSSALGTSISFSHELVPTRTMAGDSVSVSEALIKNVSSVLSDTPSITESPAINVSQISTDSFSVSDAPVFNLSQVLADTASVSAEPSKIFQSEIDFDLSDSDIDPDPVTVSDAIVVQFEYDLADTPSIADSPALNVTPAGKSDSFSVSDSPVLQPSLAPTDSVTPGDSGGLVINYVYTDVDDTTLGGHIFNQTPINPGGYE